MTVSMLRNILRCITLPRLVNLVKIFSSFKISEWTGRSIVWGLPYTITIEPTNLCNLRCPECPSGTGELTRPPGSMELENYKRIIDEVAKHTFYVQLFFQGEPFINKHLIDMIRYAHQKKMYVSISTNAHFIQNGMAEKLIESKLDRLIVSIDGVTQKTYAYYRVGGKLSKVTDAIAHLHDVRRQNGDSQTDVILQFLVTKQNEHEVRQLQTMAKKYDADVALKTIQVYSLESAARFLPTSERYHRYRIENGKLVTKNKMKNRCVRLWERSVITWDGTVVPCCFDKDGKYPLGNVNEHDFKKIWRSKTYHAFRRKILSNRKGVDMCTNCTEGLKVYR